MSRKRKGSKGFSFTRLANIMVPNFFADTAPTITSALVGLRKDMCYAHQLSSPNPFALDERSFYVAGVADNEAVSRKMYKALKKHGILRADDGNGSTSTSTTTAAAAATTTTTTAGDDGNINSSGSVPPLGVAGPGEVDTRKIGQSFIHQLASINVMRQRELINMLFWWEEETQRLKKLVAEESELDAIIQATEEVVAAQERRERQRARRESENGNGNSNVDDNNDDNDEDNDNNNDDDDGDDDNSVGRAKEKLDQLKFARERIRMKKRQRPSQRRADVEADKDNLMEAFYGGGSRNAPPLAQTSSGVQDNGKPPEYYAPG